MFGITFISFQDLLQLFAYQSGATSPGDSDRRQVMYHGEPYSFLSSWKTRLLSLVPHKQWNRTREASWVSFFVEDFSGRRHQWKESDVKASFLEWVVSSGSWDSTFALLRSYFLISSCAVLLILHAVQRRHEFAWVSSYRMWPVRVDHDIDITL